VESVLYGTAPVALILGMLAIMASKTLTPVRAKPAGTVEYELQLGLMQRALAQKANVLSICLVVVLGGGAFGFTRWLPPVLSLVAIAAMVGMLLKPQRVVFTSAGVMPNNAVFRPWKDFDSFSFSGNRIVLHSPTRLASINLFASYKRRDEVERVIRRHLRAPKVKTTRAASTNTRPRRAV
jgi:hypothetical protein